MTLKTWMQDFLHKPRVVSQPNFQTRRRDDIFCNGRVITADQQRELHDMMEVGIEAHAMMKTAADRCCEVLGIDPDVDSVERDFASDIVFHQTEPKTAIEMISKRIEQLGRELSC